MMATALPAGVGESWTRLAAHVEAAEGRRVRSAVKKSAVFIIGIFLEHQAQGALGKHEVARIERGFEAIEQRDGGKDLIVERSVEADFVQAVGVEATGFQAIGP